MRALAWNPQQALHEPAVLDEVNASLERMSAEERVSWAIEHLPGPHALSSSFGAQAAGQREHPQGGAPQQRQDFGHVHGGFGQAVQAPAGGPHQPRAQARGHRGVAGRADESDVRVALLDRHR